MIVNPCGLCHGAVAFNHKAIVCDICQKWVHIKCNKLDKNDYKFFQDDINQDDFFFCINCLADNIPFSKLNNNEFCISVKKGVISSDDVDTNFVPSDFQQHIFDQLNQEINNNAFDLDTENNNFGDEIIPAIDCQYYSIDDFTAAQFDPNKSFSILHLNIHSIQRHIEEFRVILQLMDFKFDIICISESKIIKDCVPKIDINIAGYADPLSTPTESTKGGVLIYVKSGLVAKPRPDLNIYKKRSSSHFLLKLLIQKKPMILSVSFIDIHVWTLPFSLMIILKELSISCHQKIKRFISQEILTLTYSMLEPTPTRLNFLIQ